MNTHNLIVKGIELSNEAKYLLDIYPELANYGKLQKLVTEWNDEFKAAIASNREV